MAIRKVAAPSARTDGLIIERLDQEALVYDTERNEAHSLSPLAAAVFDLADGRRSADELATLASERLAEPVGADAVAMALAQLGERELLTDSSARDTAVLAHSVDSGGAVALGDGLTRRDMVRRSAFAGAAAASLTLITTVVAPTPAAAQSPGVPPPEECVPAGEECTGDSECCDDNICVFQAPRGETGVCRPPK